MAEQTKVMLNLTSGHRETLHGIAGQAGESVSSLVRRMVDYCVQPGVLCNLFPPYLSGQIKMEIK